MPTVTAKKLSPAQQARLVESYFRALDRGKKAYGAADKALEAVVSSAPIGAVIDLGGGRTATVVDQFANKNKVWKPCGVNRLVLELSHA